MTKGIFHKGSGLGNQLHRYIGTRVTAKDGKFGMVAPELFKGASFIKLDMGETHNDYDIEHPSGRVIPKGCDFIDGEFQDEYYLEKMGDWIQTEPLEMPDDVGVINFRGGEYVGVPDLFLPKVYWDKAIAEMRKINPNMKFEVHTDDPYTAYSFFPDFPIASDIELNWRSIRHAKYLILSNSSFAIIPAHLNTNVELVLAPKFWAGYNKKIWQLECNNYKKFKYIHHED